MKTSDMVNPESQSLCVDSENLVMLVPIEEGNIEGTSSSKENMNPIKLISETSPTEIETCTGDEQSTKGKKRCSGWLTPQFQVYVSHFLSSWGDRMWMFAGGLFLIDITPASLRLIAIYEGCISVTVIMAGAPVGRWVDRTDRLKAAQLSLFTQNTMVCACTLLLCLLRSYKETFEGVGEYAMQAQVEHRPSDSWYG